MQFASHASSFDIVSDINFLAGADANSYPIADKTRNVNLGYDRAVSLILRADGRWQWDDTNATDLPIATATLTSGQQEYGFNSAHIKVLRVAVKDRNGDYFYLESMDQGDFHGQELLDRDAGTPRAYEKLASSIILDRAPDYTQSAGIKIYFQRNITYFTTSDTTKVPGFAEPYHRLLSLYAARDYCVQRDMDKRQQKIENDITKLETELIAFYSQRSRDERPSLKVRNEDYGALDN